MNRTGTREVQADVIRLKKGGADVETLLGLMRGRGLGQADSFLMLARVCGMEFAQAQKVLFDSETWADRREVNAKLQEDLAQAVLELSQESDSKIKIEVDWERDPEGG